MWDTEQERKYFWKRLNTAIEENGQPFAIKSRTHYATINQKSASSNLCLSLDFLLTKGFLRIGIYIHDDSKTPHFERLYARKEAIEQALGFHCLWTKRGEKNPNTRRIEVQLPFTAYDRDDYERLIEESLPIIMKYIEVFSYYIPEAIRDIRQ